MQDYNYIFAGCFELTLEMSCCKFPANETELMSFWQRNRDALIMFLVQAHMGMYLIMSHRYVFVSHRYVFVSHRYVFVSHRYVFVSHRYVFVSHQYVRVLRLALALALSNKMVALPWRVSAYKFQVSRFWTLVLPLPEL